MKIIIHPGEKKVDVPAGKRLKEVLKHLNINRESVIVSRRGKLITDDETLGEDDVVEIWHALSGG